MPPKPLKPLLEKFELYRASRNPNHFSIRIPEQLIRDHPTVLSKGSIATVSIAEDEDSLTIAYRFAHPEGGQ